MDNSYRFFANHDCKYYPCHEGIEELNCLFCYCPFYLRTQCPGNPAFVETKKGIVKDCTGCCFPHRAENYEVILEWLRCQVYRSPEDVGGKDRVISEEAVPASRTAVIE